MKTLDQEQPRYQAHEKDDAPEVVPPQSGLMPTHDYSEDPEVVNVYQQFPKQRPEETQAFYTSYNPDVPPTYNPQGNVEFDRGPTGHARPRKRWLWILAGVAILVVGIGAGVGLGVGLGSRKSSSTEASNAGSNTSSGSALPISATSSVISSTASATTSAVTSGTTGLASYSCNSTEDVTISTGTTYTQECSTQYQTVHPGFYNTSITIINLGGKYIRYSFEDCMATCDKYNEDPNNQPPCRAVTYYANMTYPNSVWGGNCFLKNDRGHGYNTDPVDYSTTASAYMSCLNVTCFASGFY